ncbi:uncharacterized protein [Miscanthus floridulus]|uniref:uncharacterized protein n=1 Tax=Miscanthus floridulus TaxID=154761 RepID=UPI003458F6FC
MDCSSLLVKAVVGADPDVGDARLLADKDLGAHNQWEQADDNGSQLNRFDKANWTSEGNTHIFCELCVEQIREGNCPNGQMKNIAYKIIAQKYFERTGLNHEVKQFKNRWTQCKTMWQWHDWSQGETGLGRNENGTIIADDDRKKYAECKKFRWAIPSYINHLVEMFQGNTVDGRSSCIPGGNSTLAHTYGEEDDQDGDAEEDRGTHASPMSTEYHQSKEGEQYHRFSLKPSQEEQESNDQGREGRLEEEQVEQDIDHCMSLVKECGLAEGTEELYVATMLFAQKYNRTIFKKLTRKVGVVEEVLPRLEWLNC